MKDYHFDKPRKPGMLDAVFRSKTRIAIATISIIGMICWAATRKGSLAESAGQGEPPLLQATAINVLSPSATGETFCYKEVKMNRWTYGSLLQNETDMEIGIELGVQEGVFAESILKQWTKCKKYILVDLWKHQDLNYEDVSNFNDQKMDELYLKTKERLKPFEEQTNLEYMKMYTSEAAKQIPDGSLDFVYVDARHDYCGCTEDMELFWPKLREGGLMAGHDYVLPRQWQAGGQDWTICEDGSKHSMAVIGAVSDFATKNDLQVVVTPYCDWNSWMIRKPRTICKQVVATSET